MIERLLLFYEDIAKETVKQNTADRIIEYAEKTGFDGYKDKLENVIVRKKGSGQKVILAAPISPPALICRTADDSGFLRLHPMGISHLPYLRGRKTVFPGEAHGITDFCGEKDKYEADCLFCDINADSKDDALAICPPGTAGTLYYTSPVMERERIYGGGLSVFSPAAILLRLMEMSFKGDDDIYFVFHSKHFLGYGGLKTAAYSINADKAFLIDTSPAADTPGEKQTDKGFFIKLAEKTASFDKDLSLTLLKNASILGVAASLYVSEEGKAGSDAARFAAGGLTAASISLPIRYFESENESFFIKDAEGIIALLKESL